jgi:signal transduction histidine kinase
MVMDLTGRSHRLYRLAVWITALVPLPVPLFALDPQYRTAGLVAWIGCYTVFLVLMALGRRQGRQGLAVLALESTAALGAAACLPTSIEGAMLVAVAAQLAARVPLPAAVTVAVAQTLAFGAILAASRPIEIALDVPLAWLAFEIFAILLTVVARSEADGRVMLLERNVQLLATRQLLAERSRVAERLRIARDLHDGLGHHLTALNLNLEAAAHLVDGPGTEHIQRAQRVTRTLLQEVRASVSGVRDEGLDPIAAIRALVEPIDLPCVHLSVPGALPPQDATRGETLLRLVQEIVTNALRHADARNLWISVAALGTSIEIEGRDDGRGATAWDEGNGLRGMRERIVALDGSLDVASSPGRGFRVLARIPHPAQAAP